MKKLFHDSPGWWYGIKPDLLAKGVKQPNIIIWDNNPVFDETYKKWISNHPDTKKLSLQFILKDDE